MMPRSLRVLVVDHDRIHAPTCFIGRLQQTLGYRSVAELTPDAVPPPSARRRWWMLPVAARIVIVHCVRFCWDYRKDQEPRPMGQGTVKSLWEVGCGIVRLIFVGVAPGADPPPQNLRRFARGEQAVRSGI